MLGLNPWLIIAVLLGFAGAFGGGYWRGYRAADKSAEIEIQAKAIQSLEVALAEQRRQAAATKLIAEAANARQQEAERMAGDMAAEIEEYVRRLEQAPKPACDCGLTAADVERLRHIAGPRASTPSRAPARPADRPRAGAGDQGGG